MSFSPGQNWSFEELLTEAETRAWSFHGVEMTKWLRNHLNDSIKSWLMTWDEVMLRVGWGSGLHGSFTGPAYNPQTLERTERYRTDFVCNSLENWVASWASSMTKYISVGVHFTCSTSNNDFQGSAFGNRAGTRNNATDWLEVRDEGG